MASIFIIILNITRTGGTERAVINLANILVKKYDVTILSLQSKKKESPYFAINEKVKIQHLEICDIPSNIFYKLKWQKIVYEKLTKIMKSNSIVIGTGHNINVLLPFLKKIKRIACEHIQLDSIPKSHRIIMRLLYPLNDALVVLSNSAYEKYKNYNRNIQLIPNSLPFEIGDSSTLLHKRIIMVGRLSHEKGYDRILKIATYISENYPEWSIHIFGNGPMKNKLEELYCKEGLNKWIYIHEPTKTIQDEYLKSSIYMMTSYNEALPMVLLEAKSCGLPVIAYECEGTKSLIKDGYDGFLIEDDNSDIFIRKLGVLIDDVDIRRRLGKNAIDSSKAYSSSEILNKWVKLIKSFIV
mgnify:CR=1 FL=1